MTPLIASTGLELGTDDCVAKPFDAHEVLARIRAVLLRQGTSQPAAREQTTYAFSGWTFDPRRRTRRTWQIVLVVLTSGKFDLLLASVEYPQQILHGDRLLDLARGRVNQAFDCSIDVRISRLCHELELDPTQPQLITTIRSEGYIFAADFSRPPERRS